jgi:hypothetical protein
MSLPPHSPHPVVGPMRRLQWIAYEAAIADRTLASVVKTPNVSAAAVEDRRAALADWLGKLDRAYAAVRRTLEA